jgi:hypothetical protein
MNRLDDRYSTQREYERGFQTPNNGKHEIRREDSLSSVSSTFGDASERNSPALELERCATLADR